MIEAKNRHAKQEPVKPVQKQQRVFKSIPVNLNDKIAIVIDRKTTVFVRPGADIEKIRAKYAKKELTKSEKL